MRRACRRGCLFSLASTNMPPQPRDLGLAMPRRLAKLGGVDLPVAEPIRSLELGDDRPRCQCDLSGVAGRPGALPCWNGLAGNRWRAFTTSQAGISFELALLPDGPRREGVRARLEPMISPLLPAPLKKALDAKLEGLSRRDAAARAGAISATYRAGGDSATIRTDDDALAYALARMPATYAAAVACLNALIASMPDFSPRTLLDIGAGPGTASFAAADAFPSLNSFVLIDRNEALRALAIELAGSAARMSGMTYRSGEARAATAKESAADIVIASYMIGEIGMRERAELAELMWSKARDTLLIIEPGTPAGHARILAARATLIRLGAHVSSPCPHDRDCPLTPPDWCHFAQRLARTRAHKQIKGAALPFEDEKLSYVALTRSSPCAPRAARVLAPPVVGKAAVSARLCTVDGLALARVPRRDKAAYARARRWRWGDAIMNGKEPYSSRE